jgi:hypothetical protein
MTPVESFQTLPLQAVIPSYLYQQYADDEDLQAFVRTQNALAQGYLNWFNATPLGLYTSANITGPLLDWIAQGIYDQKRPVLASQTAELVAGYNSVAYNTIAYDDLDYTPSGTASLASDDVYKRVMTWNLYRGDDKVFCLQWLKNRVSRFLHGSNGSDSQVLNMQPSISVAGSVFTITDFASGIFHDMQLCFIDGFLSFPFQYQAAFNAVNFTDSGSHLALVTALYFPVSASGLPPGAVWDDAGIIHVVPGITPDPTAPPLMFSTIDPIQLMQLGGGNLPLSNPGVTGQLWNNSGVVSIA